MGVAKHLQVALGRAWEVGPTCFARERFWPAPECQVCAGQVVFPRPAVPELHRRALATQLRVGAAACYAESPGSCLRRSGEGPSLLFSDILPLTEPVRE